MPGWMILSLVVFGAACAALVAWHVARRPFEETDREQGEKQVPRQVERGEPWFSGWFVVGAFALAAVLMFVSAYNPVGTKEEGVKTSFGRTAGQLDNGPHLTWPWIIVHEMDAAVQTDTYGGKKANAGDCINVRIANQQTGCAFLSFQWRIRPIAVDELYKDYRSFDHVRDALVTRKLTSAVNETLADYNPLDSITTAGSSIGSKLPDYATAITKIMRREVGDRIEVLSTLFPLITFDDETQGRINQLQQQVALTRVAEQEKKTNEAKSRANDALAKSVNTSPNVLVSRCIDALEAMVKQHQPVPAGFSCWPGGGVAAVIAGPTGK